MSLTRLTSCLESHDESEEVIVWYSGSYGRQRGVDGHCRALSLIGQSGALVLQSGALAPHQHVKEIIIREMRRN